MANSSKPFGLRAVNTLLSGDTSSAVKQYLVESNVTADIYIGDPVKLAGDANYLTAGGMYYPTAVKATSTDVVIGVMTGVVPRPGYLDTPQYVKSADATKRLILVNTDPNQVYEIQADGTMTTAHVGRNANFTESTGSTTTGISNTMLETSTVETTTSLDLQILNIAPEPDNELGVYTRCLVRLNVNQFRSGATGI